MKQAQKTIEPRRLTHSVKSVIKKQIKRLYINKELTEFILKQIELVPNRDKVALLYFIKKTVLQTYRCPDPNHYGAFEDEYKELFSEIALEQAFYEPIQWIDAEIAYHLNTGEKLTSEDVDRRLDVMLTAKQRLSKDWLTTDEVMLLFGYSESTLDRRIGKDGMPFHQKGGMKHFYLEELTAWMRSDSSPA